MRFRGWSAGIAVGLSLVAPVISSTPASATVSTAPENGSLFGAFVKPETGSLRKDVEGAITNLERDLGVTLGIDQHFFPWGTPIPGWQAAWDVQNGRVPLVTWGDVDVAQVNAGAHDAYIAARADAIKAVGAPVQLRWFAEMDGGAKQHLSRSPAEYIAAWKRIHGIFEQRGADNTEWVWCPNAWGFTSGENAPAWYPGDAYVDWLCADGYNWAPGDPKAQWRSFAWVFQPFYDWGLKRDKPMMVGETGVQERNPGEKPAWVADAAVAMQTLFPEMKAFVYFDENKLYDWRIRSSGASVAAFREMAQSSYFLPGASLGDPAPDPSTDPTGDPGATTETDPGTTATPEPELEIEATPKGKPRGQKKRVRLTLSNEGRDPGTFAVKGSWRPKRVRVRLSLNGSNVTRQMSAGHGKLPVIGPGETLKIQMRARIQRRKAVVGFSVWDLQRPGEPLTHRVRLRRGR